MKWLRPECEMKSWEVCLVKLTAFGKKSSKGQNQNSGAIIGDISGKKQDCGGPSCLPLSF